MPPKSWNSTQHVKPDTPGSCLPVPGVRSCHRHPSSPCHCMRVTVGDVHWLPGIATGSPSLLPTVRVGLLCSKCFKGAPFSLLVLEIGPGGKLGLSVQCCKICFSYRGSHHSGDLQRSRNALFSS